MNRLELLLSMLKESPNDSFLIYAVAIEKNAAGDITSAIKDLKLLVVNDKNYLASYYKLGQLLAEISEIENAIEIYKAGLEIATTQNNLKTKREIKEAIMQLTDEFD